MKPLSGAVKMTLVVVLSLVFGAIIGFGLMQVVYAQEAGDDLATVDLTGKAEPADARDALADVLEWLEQVHALKANFIQHGPDGTIAQGTMYLERPGKVRFEYEPSVPILIVADGKTLNFIDYDVGQVTSWPVADTPLALLLEPAAVLKDKIDVVEAGAGPLAGTVAVTADDPKHPEYGTVTLMFERGDGAALTLRAWHVRDAQGLSTTVTLAEVRVNVDLDNALFRFEDPRAGPVQRRRRPG